MTYVNERVLIVTGHAWQCSTCRSKLQADPDGVLMQQGLSREERQMLNQMEPGAWATVSTLAEALGVARCDLEEAMRHPRSRLRHF
ncbi:MAG: hypothetical protein H8D78_10890 [Chloroflexi bacterium]|nr:hypothetical protein [Chloroflexota bacterium]